MNPTHLTSPHTYPLSYNQRGFWLIYQDIPENTVYNMALPLQFAERVNLDLLQQAVQQLVERHPMLRTIFIELNGIPHQQQSVVVTVDKYWQQIDASGLTEAMLLEQVRQASQQPFVLEERVFRATVFVGAAMGTLLLFTLHHIAGDATSLTVLGRELLHIYAALADGKTPALSPVTKNYSSYVWWEAALLDSAKGRRMSTYWQKHLAGEVPILQLPTAFLRPPVRTFNGASVKFELPSELTTNLIALAKAHKSTLFTVLLCAYQVLLHRYSGQADIWVSVPTATPRNKPEFAEMIGCLVNAMVVRMQFVDANPLTFSKLIKQIRRQTLTNLYHQPYPFSRLVEQLQLRYHPAYQPPVQVMFAFEGHDLMPQYFTARGYTVKRHDVAQMEGEFDLHLTWSEDQSGGPLSGVLRYNRDLFEPITIVRLAEHLQTLLAGIARDAEQSIYQLPLLTEAEYAWWRHHYSAWYTK